MLPLRRSMASMRPILGHGIVGGYMDSFEAIGREAARIGLRILAGEGPESLPPATSQTQAFMVDWRQLRRWGLDEARLPPGTIVRFEQPSLWEQYRKEILAVIAVVMLQSAFIVALLLQARRRRRAEELLRESEERYRRRRRDPDRADLPLPAGHHADIRQRRLLPLFRPQPGGARRHASSSSSSPSRSAPPPCRTSSRSVSSPRAESYEHQVLRPDGSTGWQQWIDHAIRDADGQVVELQGIGRDITELKARGDGGAGAAQGSDASDPGRDPGRALRRAGPRAEPAADRDPEQCAGGPAPAGAGADRSGGGGRDPRRHRDRRQARRRGHRPAARAAEEGRGEPPAARPQRGDDRGAGAGAQRADRAPCGGQHPARARSALAPAAIACSCSRCC